MEESFWTHRTERIRKEHLMSEILKVLFLSIYLEKIFFFCVSIKIIFSLFQHLMFY